MSFPEHPYASVSSEQALVLPHVIKSGWKSDIPYALSVEDHGVPGISLPYKIAHAPSLKDILYAVRHRQEVIGEAAQLVVNGKIAEALSNNKLVTVSDGSNKRAVGTYGDTEQLTLIELDRLSTKTTQMTIYDPHVVVNFKGEGVKKEAYLFVHGRLDPEGEQTYVYRLSSDGPMRPREFTIAAEGKDILLARVDKTGSISMSMEYAGPTSWFINGEDAVSVAKAQAARNRLYFNH